MLFRSEEIPFVKQTNSQSRSPQRDTSNPEAEIDSHTSKASECRASLDNAVVDRANAQILKDM